jgi:MerR family transcriptional regulator, light-induced transcriptional regulator
MAGVDKGGQTVTATRFAELTGVSRERLRTWERRYGFPEPRRTGAGPRRYALADVARVVAVRRAAEAGVPLPRAIATTAHAAAPAAPAAVWSLAVHEAPLPVAALSGPLPVRVEHVNAHLAAIPGTPRPGDELAVALPAFHGSEPLALLQALFAAEPGPVECVHPAWDGRPGASARSVAFRVPAGEPGQRPLVAMVGLEGEGERAAREALGAARRELEDLRRREERHTRWLDALAALAHEFQHEPGPGVVANGLDVVIRQTNAVDGALATHVAGQLVVPRSRRGLLDVSVLTVAGHPELARTLRDGAPAWLAPAASAALGVPDGLHASGVPVLVAGETLGMLVFLFNEAEPHDERNRRLLAAVSAAMGFALLRDRLASELREAAEGR